MQDQTSPIAILGSSQIAADLLASIETDLLPRTSSPTSPANMLALIRWARQLGIEAEARHDLQRIGNWLGRMQTPHYARLKTTAERLERRSSFTDEELSAWLKHKVSRHPARLEALARDCLEIEKNFLKGQAARLQSCGSAWGRVVTLFWKHSNGTESSRTFGLHSCKSRFCPKCARRKSFQRSEDILKVMELAKEWDIRPENVRFLTLTIKNGADIPTLQKLAHKAWAKLQRRRWWPRWVFGWFRATECITGQDGNWNLHLHVVLLLWSQNISYKRLWDEWGSAVGSKSQVDIDLLHTQKFREARRRGGLAAAARYVAKYLSKSDLQNIREGPGGLAHYVCSMRHMRTFSMGGGAAVLRRFSEVLLPNWAPRVEGVLEDAYLRDGMPAYRQVEIDPQTGESIETVPMAPALDAEERKKLSALARPLRQIGDTVGEPCGPKKHWRSIGYLPANSKAIRVKDLEMWLRQGGGSELNPIQGMRKLIAGGDWRLFLVDYERPAGNPSLARGNAYGTLKQSLDRLVRKKSRGCHRSALPGKRYAWRDVSKLLWEQFQQDDSSWGNRRREAFRAWSLEHIGELIRRDTAGVIISGYLQAKATARCRTRLIQQAMENLQRSMISQGLRLVIPW